MSLRLVTPAIAGLTLALAGTLVGCVPGAGPETVPTATSSEAATPEPSQDRGVRFVIECEYFSGRTIDVDGGLSM